MIRFELGEDEIDTVAKAILEALNGGGIALLRGELASGKTTLVKHIAKLYGVGQDKVSSPTFSVMNRYGADFFHYDIYQNGVRGMVENGLFENLQESGLHLIEWGDEELEAILKRYGLAYIVVEISSNKSKKRLYKVYTNA